MQRGNVFSSKRNVKVFFERVYADKRILYTFFGACFGVLFPVFAVFIKLHEIGEPFAWATIKLLHSQSFLFYIIDTAPFFLGAFAFIAGRAQSKTQELLFIDRLTKLPNRYSADELLKYYGTIMNEKSGYLTIVLLNLSSLKKINSLMGISFGNDVLFKVANVIQSMCRDGETLFRVTGNEFIVVKLGAHMKDLTGEISERFAQPLEVNNINCYVAMNIGVAYCTAGYDELDLIIDHAYSAMNIHKYTSNEKYVVFDESMKPKSMNVEIESNLFNALKLDEFFMVYQPVVDCKTKEIRGCEALIRWNSPIFGVVSPAFFVPILERTKLIMDTGIWILETSCAQAKHWQAKYNNPSFFMSINVSVSQLFDLEFVNKLDAIVKNIGIDKSTIRLEITESVSEAKRNFVRDKIQLLWQHGYKLSIDDFGTGYSSLAELDSMPLYSLKVDKSFVDRIGIYAKVSPVIEMIVDMSHKMDMVVVIEGVETEAQYNYLNTIDCDYIQGYYFHKPLLPEIFEAELDKRKVR